MRYIDVVRASNPVVHLPLDDGPGSTTCREGASSSGFTGTVNGSPTFQAIPFPAGGRAIWFPATSAFVTLPDDPAWSPSVSGAYTIEAWYYTDTGVGAGANQRRCIVSKAASTQYEWFLFHESDTYGVNCWNFDLLTLAGGDHLTCTDANGSAYPGRWFHLVGTVTPSSRADLYVNGRLVASDTTSSGSMGNGSSLVRIGDDSLTGVSGFAVAHVALYTKILPHSRITAHYQAGMRRPTRLPFRTRAI